jgi:Cu/Ag efflux pump CusA
LLQTLPGATDVQLRSPPGTPLLDIQLDLAKLNHYGLRPAQVLDLLQTAYASRVVGKNYEGNRLYNIAVTLPPALRTQLESIRQLPLRSLDGQYLTLAQVADVHQSEGRYNILHEGAQRRQTVTCNISHHDLAVFLAQLKQAIAQKIQLPEDMVITYSGTAIEQAAAKWDLIWHSLLAGAGVLLLIFIAIGNARNVLLTLCNLPFALIGGVITVLLTDASLSVGSVVGFITLFGITVRNSIMLLSHYQHLVEIEDKHWNLSTAIQGAQERLPSILMTASVTALAMLPVAFNSDNPGREIMGPMAAIIIGGLVSSTCLNLLLLPVLLARFGRFKAS